MKPIFKNLISFFINLILMYMGILAALCVCPICVTNDLRHQERVSGPLRSELEMTGRYHIDQEHQPSTSTTAAAGTLNCWAVSLAPTLFILYQM